VSTERSATREQITQAKPVELIHLASQQGLNNWDALQQISRFSDRRWTLRINLPESVHYQRSYATRSGPIVPGVIDRGEPRSCLRPLVCGN